MYTRRWAVIKAMEQTKHSYVLLFFFFFSDIFPKDLIPLVEQIAAAYDKKIEDPYANEMRGKVKTRAGFKHVEAPGT